MLAFLIGLFIFSVCYIAGHALWMHQKIERSIARHGCLDLEPPYGGVRLYRRRRRDYEND